MRDQITLYQDIARRHSEAPHGQKQAVLKEACDLLGINLQALYRKFDDIGYSFKRKLRSDKGDTSISLEDARLICGMIHQTRRKNDKRLLSCEDAIEIAFANGQIREKYNSGSVFRVAKLHGFHPDQLAQPEPHIQMRSLHPNHVWQVDASIGTLFYLPKGGVEFFDETKHYKNKPENLKKVRNDLCIRYVITDHCSGFIYVRYYSASGETQEILFDLLVSAFMKKERIALHGVPFILVMDKGAANTAHAVKAFLDKMKVQHYPHKTGNSRAKGSVEKAQDIVERNFEGGLRLREVPVKDMQELNRLAVPWMIYFNETKKHSRHGQDRSSCWLTIETEQLRISPQREVLEALFNGKPLERKVAGDLTITFKAKGMEAPMRYSVEHIPGIKVADYVLASINPYRAPNVDIIMTDIHGIETYYECTPIEINEAGFYADAPVFGEEIQSAPDTVTDIERKAILKAAYDGAITLEEAKTKEKKGAQLYGGKLDPHKHINNYLNETRNVTPMPKAGVEMAISAPKQVFEKISVPEACKRIKGALGSDYPADTYSYLIKKYPDGIDPIDLDTIANQLINRNKLKVISRR